MTEVMTADAVEPSLTPEPPAVSTLTIDGWREQGAALKKTDSDLRWALADWLVRGEDTFGSADTPGNSVYTIACELFPDHPRKYFRNLAYVARNVPASVRQDALSFTHHEVVAGMDRAAQTRWLTHAVENNNMSVTKLRTAIKYECQPRIFPVPLPYAVFDRLSTLSRALRQSEEALVTGAVEMLLATNADKVQGELDAALQANAVARAKDKALARARSKEEAEWTRRVTAERAAYIREHPEPVRNLTAFDAKVAEAKRSLDIIERRLNKPVLDKGLADKLERMRAERAAAHTQAIEQRDAADTAQRAAVGAWHRELYSRFPATPPNVRAWNASVAAQVAKELADEAAQLAARTELTSTTVPAV